MQRDPKEGLFTPDDTLWRVHRELLIMLAGSRALLLELAHPAVAAGVGQHSAFQRNPVRRLFNTLRVMQRLSFGDARSVREGARQMHRCHREVHGLIDGTVPYDANDPALRLWVFATVLDSALVTFDLFVSPLPTHERAAYYEGARRMAPLLGIPAAIMPQTLADFELYMRDMVHGGSLCVGATAQEIVGALFGRRWAGWIIRLASFAGIGLLPAAVREAYAIPWSDHDQRKLCRLAAFCRRARRLLPDVLCVQPEAWLAERLHASL